MGIVSNFKRLRDGWNSVDLPEIVADIAEEHEAELAQMNREQLLAGKDNQGRYLIKYTDDPFFKSREAAIRYMNWKKHISPNKDKPADVADFFISGYTHGTIFANRQGKSIVFDSTGRFNASILQKTNGAYLGLNEESRKQGWITIFRVPAIHKINALTGAKIRP